MNRIEKVRARVAPLMADDVDTDQIIPARYLKVVDKEGLKDGLFAEWRKSPDFVLHRPEVANAHVLLAGRNFGCGSSREHAPWALLAGGFTVVIALSFADIFKNNALKNGLLPVALSAEDHAALAAAVRVDPAVQVEVDLVSQRVRFPGVEAAFSVDPFARECLLKGVDELGYLLEHEQRIAAFEKARATV
jgi:3-isopropylmalate/(R)-2-methylmalate dehydratase small subunit